jgi:hypothetical protein
MCKVYYNFSLLSDQSRQSVNFHVETQRHDADSIKVDVDAATIGFVLLLKWYGDRCNENDICSKSIHMVKIM